MNQNRGQVVWKVVIKDIAEAKLMKFGDWLDTLRQDRSFITQISR